MTAFPVPSSAFAILKGGFHPPAEPIFGNAPFARSPIRNHDQRFFFCRIPKDAQLRFNRLILPQTHRAMKALPWLTYQLAGRDTLPKLPTRRSALTGMLPHNAEEIMPVILLAQLHHRKTAKRAITDDRAICASNMRSQSLEKFINAFPEPSIPFLPPRHHFPYER